MLDIISNNPYRVLGVYSNSPKREIVANLSILKAGKSVSFPTDKLTFLPDVVRTSDTVADANSKLSLPSERFRCAQFWFVNKTPIDEKALNHLITTGHIYKAISIWKKKKDASSLQNRIVCNLIDDNIHDALVCAETLYSSYKKEFVRLILGDNPMIDIDNVVYDFLDELCDGLWLNEILQIITNEDWKQHFLEQTVKQLSDKLKNAVKVAKASKGNGPEARYDAGRKLLEETRKPLAELKELTKGDNSKYQKIADEVGNEILQCGIDYSNGSNDNDALQNAKDLLSSVKKQEIMVGEWAKVRLEENYNGLQKRIDDKIVDYINKLLDVKSNSVYVMHTVKRWVREGKEHLDAIKPKSDDGNQEYDDGNRKYIDKSSNFVFAAVSAMNLIIKGVQKDWDHGKLSVSDYKRAVSDAKEVTEQLKSCDMNQDTEKNFNDVKKELEKAEKKFESKGGNQGCVIIVIIVVIIIILFAIFSS